MDMKLIRIASWLTIASAIAAPSLAREPRPDTVARGDAQATPLPQLLAEFHGSLELSRRVSQRRIDVINALRHAGQPLIDAMRADLANADPAVRTRALRVLQSVGNQARPLLPEVQAAAGADETPGVRSVAVAVLCNLRDPRAFDTLVRATRDSDSGVRMSVIRYGKAALEDAPFAVAVRALADSDLHVRMAGLQELSLSQNKRAAAYVAPLLNDETVLHHEVRNGVKTSHRVCDQAVMALEYHVNKAYPLPGNKTQADYDELVKWWRAWWKENGEKFDSALYEEPDLQQASK
jgi:HEAT repeat protein